MSGSSCLPFAPGHFARATMSFKSTLYNSASTALFVFIWSSGAIFTEWELQHASALMFLVLRFTIALVVLTVIGIYRRRWRPEAVLASALLQPCFYSPAVTPFAISWP